MYIYIHICMYKIYTQIYIHVSARPNQLFMFPYYFVHFTKQFYSRSIQIFKILFQGFYAPGSYLPHKIVSAQDCAVLVLFLNIVESLISA